MAMHRRSGDTKERVEDEDDIIDENFVFGVRIPALDDQALESVRFRRSFFDEERGGEPRPEAQGVGKSRTIRLLRPSRTNGWMGLHAHVVGSSCVDDETQPNVRATSLAMAMGLYSIRFRGDVFATLLRFGGGDEYEDEFAPGLRLRCHLVSLYPENIFIACCVTPTLRWGYGGGKVDGNDTDIPDWLGNATAENYREAGCLMELERVMNMNGSQGFGYDNEDETSDEIGTDEDETSDESETDEDETSNESGTDEDETSDNFVNKDKNNKSILLEAEILERNKEVVATATNGSNGDDDNSENNGTMTTTTLCLHCRRPCSTLCSSCGGAYLCHGSARNCATYDGSDVGEDVGCLRAGWSHRCLCSTWKVYVERRKELSSFPKFWSWTDELLSAPNWTSEATYRDFLKNRNLLGVGWWKAEVGGWANCVRHKVDVDVTKSIVTTTSMMKGMALSENLVPPDRPVELDGSCCPRRRQRLHSWVEYYNLRRISPESPAALLLTFPLTLYHVLTRYGGDILTAANILMGRPVRLHMVGVEKELLFPGLFAELGYLLHHYHDCNNENSDGVVPISDIAKTASVDMTWVVRPDLMPSSFLCSQTGTTVVQPLTPTKASNVRVQVVAGIYGSGDLHPDFDVPGGSPDMVVGLNAGILAYPSWRHLVSYLDSHPQTPAVFTDYNEHSAVHCAASVGGLRSVRSVHVNPFRQPRAMPVRCMNLPQFSNGFVYACNFHINEDKTKWEEDEKGS